jgi:orotidine-5'-phosphate decarboxylase
MQTSDKTLLSTKAIPRRERLIFALDLPSAAEARAFVDQLADSVVFYKLGLELFMGGGYFELVDALTALGKRVFVDLKFFDVPQTVASAVQRLNGRGVTFTTVHGNEAILRAACEVREDVKVLAVTVLTSLDEGDLRDLGFQCTPHELVLSRARRALEIGCDGVVSSGLEAADLRRQLGPRLLVVTPGLRPVANIDDQKRVVNVEPIGRIFEK